MNTAVVLTLGRRCLTLPIIQNTTIAELVSPITSVVYEVHSFHVS